MDNRVKDPVQGYAAVSVDNRDGAGSFVLVCDHASNSMPREFGGLGLGTADLGRHIAFDPGALGVAQRMAGNLDAPLVRSNASRLLIDCNRPLDAPDLIAEMSEIYEVPGNKGLTIAQKAERIERFYHPFHSAIEAVVLPRLKFGMVPGFIAVHSFNPIYRGVMRPWEIGIIHDADSGWALGMVELIRAETGFNVGVNQPYSPKDRVYFTLERHARSRGLPAVMIEVRNDEIATEQQQAMWGDLLSRVAKTALAELQVTGTGSEPVHARK